MSEKTASYIPRIAFIALIIGWVLLFSFSSPDDVVEWLGVENGYLLVFLMAFVSGLTLFGVSPYQLAILTLAAAGLNPFLLAVLATAGVALGDTTSYYIGYQGRTFLSGRMERLIKKISSFLERHARYMPIYVFCYGALVPFSNDFVGVTLGLARYPFWRVMLPLALGTLVFNIALALSSPYVYQYVARVFS